jgi:hypothetical protein
MDASKNDICARFRRVLDAIDREDRRPGDGESVLFRDVCAHIGAKEFDQAALLLDRIEQPTFARHVVHGHPLATVPTTAYWREQLADLSC